MSSTAQRKFQAIFFDLFNTLLHFDYPLLPEVEFQGQRLRTTSVEVYRRLGERLALVIPYEKFLEEFINSRDLATAMKEGDREIPSLRRFQILQERLGIEASGAAEFMVQVHMGEMFRIMHFPEEKRRAFEALPDYPLVLASNFDHAPTARKALETFGLARRFQAIFISEEVGWRKPSEKFFQIALQESGYPPERCLYVGDDILSDVVGATRAGFQVAWLAEIDPTPIPPVQPQWTLRHLREVLDLL